MIDPSAVRFEKGRTALAIGWMLAAFIYTALSASHYTGLYRTLAEFSMAHFGSYHPTEVFLIILLGLCLPVKWLAPKLWRRSPGRSINKDH